MPLSDVKTNRVAENTDRIMNDPQMRADFFEQAERQVAKQERWDLDEPVEAFNPDRAPRQVETYTTPPEYAVQTKSRAQEIEESLFYRTDKELADYALAHSAAIDNVLREQYLQSDFTLAA